MCTTGSRSATALRSVIVLLSATALLSAILVAAPRTAAAWSCGFDPPPVLAPAPGETDVPINTRIWLRGPSYACPDVDDATYVLFDASAIPVSTTATGISDEVDCIWVLTPLAPLAEGSRYDLWQCTDGSCDASLTFFRTGSHFDLTPPEAATAVAERRRREMACSLVHNSVTATVDIDMASETGAILVADLGGMGTLDAEQHTGHVTQVTSERTFELGRGDCEIWPWELDDHAETTIRYGVFDLAGNFSGWSEPAPLKRPELPITCTPSCGTAPPGSGLGLLLILLGLAAWASRHRIRRALQTATRAAGWRPASLRPRSPRAPGQSPSSPPR